MQGRSDILVLGGGPAGAAAGIAALRLGLTVTLLETSAAPREKPGETLHPGAAAVLDALGIREKVEKASTCRPTGHWTAWGAPATFQGYGGREGDAWRAFQVRRTVLESLLLEEFEARGGVLLRSAPPSRPLVRHGRVVGLASGGSAWLASVTIDATGARGALRRALGIGQLRLSPPLLAHYGYRRGRIGPHPLLDGNREGWTWIAQVEDDRIAWVSLRRAGHESRVNVPPAVSGFPADGGDGAADVTWRMADKLTGPGWMLVGEAAARIDPAGSHGVLRALTSGMMAARAAAQLTTDASQSALTARAYDAWMQTWFQQDVARLLTLYRNVGFDWPAPTCEGVRPNEREEAVI